MENQQATFYSLEVLPPNEQQTVYAIPMMDANDQVKKMIHTDRFPDSWRQLTIVQVNNIIKFCMENNYQPVYTGYGCLNSDAPIDVDRVWGTIPRFVRIMESETAPEFVTINVDQDRVYLT